MWTITQDQASYLSLTDWRREKKEENGKAILKENKKDLRKSSQSPLFLVLLN